ncbi:MAG: cbb3-type cytochrome oxidase subunit 3 [Geminicoccaceae bacterium]
MEELIAWGRSLWVVWLMLIFLGIVFWAYRPKNKRRFESDGMIPFREDDDRPLDSSEER